jgi:hypothetical protein
MCAASGLNHSWRRRCGRRCRCCWLLLLLFRKHQKRLEVRFNLLDIGVRTWSLVLDTQNMCRLSRSHTPVLALAPPQFELTVLWQTAIRHVPRERRLLFVQLRVLGAAIYLSFFLCSAASVQAQDAPSSFLTWLHRINRSGAHHRAPLPPLPRPRPAEFVPKPSEVAAPQQREAVAPKPSEAFPPKQPEVVAPNPSGAAAPNKASGIPD